MRPWLSALLLVSVYVLVMTMTHGHASPHDAFLCDYVLRHFHDDTGAHNAVAAILLNYRMYDTMFEALILLTAIVGMHQFLPRRADIEAGEEARHG